MKKVSKLFDAKGNELLQRIVKEQDQGFELMCAPIWTGKAYTVLMQEREPEYRFKPQANIQGTITGRIKEEEGRPQEYVEIKDIFHAARVMDDAYQNVVAVLHEGCLDAGQKKRLRNLQRDIFDIRVMLDSVAVGDDDIDTDVITDLADLQKEALLPPAVQDRLKRVHDFLQKEYADVVSPKAQNTKRETFQEFMAQLEDVRKTPVAAFKSCPETLQQMLDKAATWIYKLRASQGPEQPE